MAAPSTDLNTRLAWRMPVAVHFGWGVRERALQHLGAQRAVVMAYAQALDDPWLAAWRNTLGPRLLAWITVPDGLSTVDLARRVSQEVWHHLASAQDPVLIGLGGGSVMDLAKWLRWRPEEGRFQELVSALGRPEERPPGRRHPLWLMPTTAGTGSEVTPWATLWDTDTQPAVKRSFDHPAAFADRAWIDPALSLRCPPSVRRDSAVDALSHGLEAIWNHHRNPISTPLAVSAIRRVISTLPQALATEQPSDASAVALSLAALEAGLAFSQTRTALAHALSYDLTLERGLSHGQAVATWLPAVWRRAVGWASDVDAALSEVFGRSPEAGAEHLAQWLEELGFQGPQAFMDGRDIPTLMDQALGSARGRHFLGAPRGSA